MQPALDADGNQLWTHPQSSLFFIPARVLWIPLLLGALVLAVVGLLGH